MILEIVFQVCYPNWHITIIVSVLEQYYLSTAPIIVSTIPDFDILMFSPQAITSSTFVAPQISAY